MRRGTNTLMSLFDRGHRVNLHVADGLFVAAGPDDFNRFDMIGIAEADGDGQFRLREIAASGHDLARDRLASETNFDERADGRAIGFCANELEPNPMMAK